MIVNGFVYLLRFKMIIGITGSIATGKSFVFSRIKEFLGDKANYFDSDIFTNQLYNNEDIKKDLINIFSTCDKKKISKIVFSDKNMREKLNKYIHKIIINEMKRVIRNNDKEFLFLDVPLIYELNLEYLFDKILIVYTRKELQLERLIKRNKYTIKEAINRINSQIDIEIKKEKSNYIIDNSFDNNRTEIEILRFLNSLKKRL